MENPPPDASTPSKNLRVSCPIRIIRPINWGKAPVRGVGHDSAPLTHSHPEPADEIDRSRIEPPTYQTLAPLMTTHSTIPMTGDVLLLGAGGMLGACWRRSLDAAPAGRLLTPDRNECDLTRPETIDQCVRPGIELVINAAAYTDVDGAETEEELATLVNGHAVGRLAARCRDIGATLVHYSTDYVFNGQADSPYPVDGPRDPVNAYGRSKAVGEALIEDSGADVLLIRTSWLYAAHGKNFVRTIAGACRQRPSLRVVNDQLGRPSSADQLVSTTRRLLAAKQRGVFHGCDDGECTWFDFAKAIAARMNPECVVEPCASDEFPRPARRPAYSVLDLSPTIDAIGPITHWRDALAATLDRLAQEPTAA